MKILSKRFNLVEVIIAMGIIVVCITTILGMISAGMKVSKEVSSKTYINSIFDQISGLIDSNTVIRSNINGYIPSYAVHPYDGQDTLTKNNNASDDESDCSHSIDTSALSPSGTVDPTLEKIKFDNSSIGVMTVDFTSTLPTGSTVTDFTASVRVWLDSNNYTIPVSDDTTNSSEATITNTMVNIEITWPLTMTYEQRVLSGNVRTIRKVLKP